MATILALEGGGSGIRATCVKDGKIVRIFEQQSSITSVDQLLDYVGMCIITEAEIEATGFSLAGFVNRSGVITLSPNQPFLTDAKLAQLIRQHTGLPAIVINDLHAATLGAGRIFPMLKRFYCVNGGGGLGQRIYIDGQVYYFDERGHMILDTSPFAVLCGCGLTGCTESIIGGRSLERRVRWNTDVLGIKLPENIHPCTFLDQRFEAGDKWAVDIYRQFALGLGIYLAQLQLAGNVPAFVFRGSTVRNAFQLPKIQGWVRQAFRDRLPDKKMAQAKFFFVPEDPSQPKDYDAFLGAAELASRLVT